MVNLDDFSLILRAFPNFPPFFLPSDSTSLTIANIPDALVFKVAQLPLHKNWCEIGSHYLAEYWAPWVTAETQDMSSVLRPLHTSMAGSRRGRRVWLDTGHLSAMALMPALETFHDGAARFIRLRRSRIHLAYSKALAVGSGPCSSRCTWCHCPLDGATRCIPPGRSWQQLSSFQQYLWEIDELECQWEAFRRSRPDAKVLELNWAEHDGLGIRELRDIAKFLDVSLDFKDSGKPLLDERDRVINSHLSQRDRESMNMTELSRLDAEYQQIMLIDVCNEFVCKLGIPRSNARDGLHSD